VTAAMMNLKWRVEQACGKAGGRRARRSVDGWLLRRSGGRSRRTQFREPFAGKRGTPDKVIDAAESFYSGHLQWPRPDAAVRVPDIAGEFERHSTSALSVRRRDDPSLCRDRRLRSSATRRSPFRGAQRGLVAARFPHGRL